MRFYHSLSFRVVGTTLLLSTVLISILASALNQRLGDGIRQAKIDFALNQSATKSFQIESGFALANIDSVANFRDALDRTITDFADTKGNERNPEIIILQQNSKGSDFFLYERSTNQVAKNSISEKFRAQVKANKEPQYSYGTIIYPSNVLTPLSVERKVSALIIGEKFIVSKFGTFEIYFLYNTAPEDETISLISRTLISGSIVLVIVLLLIVWAVSRQVVTPVRRAAEIAEKLAAGNFAERMNVEGADEIARLALSFNEMATALQSQITRLENLSRVQQRFVSDVSHELRKIGRAHV